MDASDRVSGRTGDSSIDEDVQRVLADVVGVGRSESRAVVECDVDRGCHDCYGGLDVLNAVAGAGHGEAVLENGALLNGI